MNADKQPSETGMRMFLMAVLQIPFPFLQVIVSGGTYVQIFLMLQPVDTILWRIARIPMQQRHLSERLLKSDPSLVSAVSMTVTDTGRILQFGLPAGQIFVHWKQRLIWRLPYLSSKKNHIARVPLNFRSAQQYPVRIQNFYSQDLVLRRQRWQSLCLLPLHGQLHRKHSIDTFDIFVTSILFTTFYVGKLFPAFIIAYIRAGVKYMRVSA